jgi:hypothetical protein
MIVAWMITFMMITSPVQAKRRMDCTFRPKYPVVSLREGPGTTYKRVGFLRTGDSLNVIDQQAGEDGYVWWKGENNVWVRSDLGTSDCPATCGNTVCEYGETESICAQDCQGNISIAPTTTTTPSTTSNQCTYASCQACYDAFPCWPNACTQKTCTLNQYGCPTCQTAP